MSNLIKYICFVLSFSFLLISTSCKQITQVDKSINKIFKSQKKIERKSDKYKKNLGIEDDNPDADSSNDDSDGISGINSIEQKNMINQYGYLFELFNGKNPGKVIRYNYGDSIKSIYIDQTQILEKSFQMLKFSDGIHIGWIQIGKVIH